MIRRLIAPAVIVAGMLASTALAACAPSATGQHAAVATQSASAVDSPSPVLALSPYRHRRPCPPIAHGFSCRMRRHIAAVERYLRTRPGMIGIVLRDRRTGAVWQNKYAGDQVYMASTSKLAMVITLLMQDRAGVIRLSSADRLMIHEILHVSLDSAADDLWFKYRASFYTRYFPKIGLMARYLPQAGVKGPYWGEMTCTAEDLDRVVNYIFADMPTALRDYVVGEMRHVGAVQQWGVWGAGPQNSPGNKDGWSVEKPGWIVNSAGFAGPDARYTLTMMNSQGGYHDGTDTVTQVAALLFQGHHVPAPTPQATP